MTAACISTSLRPLARLVVRFSSASLLRPSLSPWRCRSAPARAVEPFVLKDIRVEGLQRADAGTVFASLPFRIGDTYNDEKGAAALRALFATGLFKDVRIDVDGDVAGRHRRRARRSSPTSTSSA